MNIIALIISFLIVSPLVGWMVFLDVVRIRRELAETRYFNSATKMLCCTECAWEDKV